MKLRAVIFDFDGTLADSLDLALDVYNQAAPELGIPQIDRATLPHHRTQSVPELINELGIPSWKLPLILQSVRTGMAQRIREVRLFPGIGEALIALNAAGLRCGILTSNTEANVRAVFTAAGAPAPELLSCGVSLFGKSTRLRRLLRTAEVTPSEACLVGDEVRDLAAARETRAHAVAVNWGYGDATALAAAHPDFLASAPADLVAWVQAAT